MASRQERHEGLAAPRGLLEAGRPWIFHRFRAISIDFKGFSGILIGQLPRFQEIFNEAFFCWSSEKPVIVASARLLEV